MAYAVTHLLLTTGVFDWVSMRPWQPQKEVTTMPSFNPAILP